MSLSLEFSELAILPEAHRHFELLAAALDLVSDGVLVLDSDWNVLVSNAAAQKLLSGAAGAGATLTDILTPRSRTRLRHATRSFARRHADAATIEVELAEDAVPSARLQLQLHWQRDEDAAGGVWMVLVKKDQQDPVEPHPASLDFLTGLPTRAALAGRLDDVRHRAARDRQYAVLFIDLDDFKQVNDAYGHLAGDSVLAEIAQRLVSAVRPDDLVARFGGDEFVIVVEDIDRRQLARLTRRIRSRLAAPLTVEDRWITVSASIGRALGDARLDPAEVLRRSDRAMYRAKRTAPHRGVRRPR